MKYILIISLLLLTGCAASQPSLESRIISTDASMTDEGQQILSDFQRKAEVGMTKNNVKKIISNIENSWYENGEPSNREFTMRNGSKYEIWEYHLYSKILVLTFEDNRLVQMTSKDGETMREKMNN